MPADAVVHPGARRLSRPTRFFYGVGSVAFGVKDNGFSYFLLIFYNQVMGLPSATVGLAIMVALVVDAFLDPVVGQVSDNWRSKWGRRHPFMYASALPVAVSYLLLWNPPAGWGHTQLFFYLIVVAVLIRSFISCYEIPSSALAAELTTAYDERTKLLSIRYLFGWIGGLAMYFAALRIFLKPDTGHATGQLSAAGYSHYGLAAAVTMLAAILISAAGTHSQIPNLRDPPSRKSSLATLFREMIGTLAHKSFLMILIASLFNAMAIGLGFSISLYFTTFYWLLPSSQIALFTFSSLAAAFLAFAIAPRLSKLFGKKRSSMVLIFLGFLLGVAPIILRLLGAFPQNGSPLIFPILFVLNIFAVGLATAGNILFSSMIADVVEDSELRTGRRQEGLFFAAAAFVAKAVTGMGIFASAMMLSAIHFPAGARPGQVPPEVLRSLSLVYVPTQAILYTFALLFLTGYTITRAGHEASLRKLAAAADLLEEGEPAGSQGRLQ